MGVYLPSLQSQYFLLRQAMGDMRCQQAKRSYRKTDPIHYALTDGEVHF